MSLIEKQPPQWKSKYKAQMEEITKQTGNSIKKQLFAPLNTLQQTRKATIFLFSEYVEVLHSFQLTTTVAYALPSD